MPDFVSDVADEARPLLNDADVQLYTDAVLLPYIKKAYDEITKELILREIQPIRELSANIQILSSTPNPVINNIQIPDLFVPIALKESTNQSDWTPMIMQDWEPDSQKDSLLRFWAWRGDEIKLLGATADTYVQVRYYRTLAVITDANSPINLTGSKTYLAARSAAIAAMSIGGRPDLATALAADAESAKDILISIELKRRQRFAVRRKPFRRRV